MKDQQKDRASSGKETPEEPKTTPCVCFNFYLEHKPGVTVKKWGHPWTVEKDGIYLKADLPAYTVDNGTNAGLWRPAAMDPKTAGERFHGTQYLMMIGKPPPKDMTVGEMQRVLQAKRPTGTQLLAQ